MTLGIAFPPLPYKANGVAYGGLGYALAGAELSGISNSFFGMFFCCFRIDGGDGTAMDIASDGVSITVSRTTGNKIQVALTTALGTVTQVSTSTYTTSTTWHVMGSAWDTNHAAGSKNLTLNIDNTDSQIIPATDTAGASMVKYASATNFAIAASTGGTVNWNGALANCWFFAGGAVAVPANVALSLVPFTINHTSATPGFVGANGQLLSQTYGLPFPTVFLPNTVPTLGTNLGLGGNFTVTSSGGFPKTTTGP